MGYIVHLYIVGGIGVIDVRRQRRQLLTAAGDKCLSECKQRDIKMHSPLDIVTRNAAKNNRQMNGYIYKYTHTHIYICVSTHIQIGLRSSVSVQFHGNCRFRVIAKRE